MLAWLSKFIRRPKPIHEATTVANEPVSLTTHDAAVEILKAVHSVRGDATSLPSNLDDLRDHVWAKLPEVVRGPHDTPAHRAELAGAIQVALLLHERTRQWMDS